MYEASYFNTFPVLFLQVLCSGKTVFEKQTSGLDKDI